MITLLTVAHVIVGISLILVVLLQRGKGASMGAAFGGSSQTLFGSRGPQSFLGKLTTIAAVVFMLTSLSLAVLSSKKPTASIMQKSNVTGAKPAATTNPVTPAPKSEAQSQGQPPKNTP
ncbi:MAG: preprotein translocase subunit SecG [Nitrospinae bacterium]|nr:preprotein translocase subunit SecG [Nitrospinota bacterium]